MAYRNCHPTSIRKETTLSQSKLSFQRNLVKNREKQWNSMLNWKTLYYHEYDNS